MQFGSITGLPLWSGAFLYTKLHLRPQSYPICSQELSSNCKMNQVRWVYQSAGRMEMVESSSETQKNKIKFLQVSV
jgi:hypothetical protein